MTTVQIVGIAVAAAVVLLLIIALLVTRRRGSTTDEPRAAQAPASFLDDAPQDTLSGLGKAEQPVEDVTVDPGVQRAAQAAAENPVPAEVRPSYDRPPDALGLDWGPLHDAPADEQLSHEPPAGEVAPATAQPASPVTESGASAAAPEPARPAEGGPAAAPEAAPESGSGGGRVPLSDIIVTTSNKMVDLQDPEVRRMLTDLVKYEVDQATHYREQGQPIDAVLQLTEAEKISRALDMRESAAAIRVMMEDLQGQV
jgi:hypothetical protein